MYELGKHVVIVGGGLVGCEVGLHIANHGHDVTIIEMLPMIANETFGYYRNALLTEMDNRGIRQILNAKSSGVYRCGRSDPAGRQRGADPGGFHVLLHGHALQ